MAFFLQQTVQKLHSGDLGKVALFLAGWFTTGTFLSFFFWLSFFGLLALEKSTNKKVKVAGNEGTG